MCESRFMPSLINLVGRSFGRLTVETRAPDHEQPSGKKIARWECRCECGNTAAILGQNLLSGSVISCGCFNKEVHTRHGATRQRSGSRYRTYRRWGAAKERCFNSATPMYRYYGGRGITMCDRWRNDFEAFLADMGECPPAFTLERVDFDGDYEPGNCTWIPKSEQAKNRRGNVLITFEGETMTLMDWSRHLGAPYPTIRDWYKYKGVPFAEIVQRIKSRSSP